MSPPPGYVAYGGPGAVSRNVSRIGGLAKVLVILLAIYIPLNLINVYTTWRLADKAKQFLDGKISKDSFLHATNFNVGGLGSLLILAIAPLTMIWMFRMAQNLRSLGRAGLRFAPGWAIGGWFTPPCAIYAVPWLMFRELWKASEPGLAPGDTSWKERKASPLVTVWWVLYGLVPLLQIISSRSLVVGVRSVGGNEQELRKLARELHRWVGLSIGLAVALSVAAAVYLVMVSQLTARHRRATGEP